MSVAGVSNKAATKVQNFGVLRKPAGAKSTVQRYEFYLHLGLKREQNEEYYDRQDRQRKWQRALPFASNPDAVLVLTELRSMRQGVLFGDKGETVGDYTNAAMMMLADVLNDARVSQLKKVLAMYNNDARKSADGEMSIDFDMGGGSGSVKSKEEIIKEVLNIKQWHRRTTTGGPRSGRRATKG